MSAHYTALGYTEIARRWRGGNGELDLVFEPSTGDQEDVVIVEVKSARDIDTALARITPDKAQRLLSTAELFLDTLPKGTLSNCRFDVATVTQVGMVTLHKGFFAGGF